MIRPQKLSSAWLSRECDSGSWQRGSRYFRNRCATLDNFERLPDGGVRLSGHCQGSLAQPYRQRIEISEGKNGAVLNGECSCPVGYNCKHVVALVLTWQALAPPEESDRDEVTEWLAELGADAKAATAPSEDALLYLILPPPAHASEPSVKFLIAQRKRDGQWGKGRKTYPAALNDQDSQAAYLRPIDEEILSLLRSAMQRPQSVGIGLSGVAGQLALIRMVQSGRAFWTRDRLGPLQLGDARRLGMEWKLRGGRYHLELAVEGGGLLVPTEPPCFIDPDQHLVGKLELPAGLNARKLKMLQRAPAIPADMAEKTSRRMALELPDLPSPLAIEYEDIQQPPTPLLKVEFDPAHPGQARAGLHFVYAGMYIPPNPPNRFVVTELDGRLVRVQRDPAAEQALRETLVEHGLEALNAERFQMAGGHQGTALRDAWFDWLRETAPELRAAGWQIEQTGRDFTISEADGVDGEVETSGSDWFSLRFDLEVDGWKMPLLPLISQLIEDYQPGDLPEKLYLDTGEGHYVAVPAEQIEPVLKTVLELFDRLDNDALTLTRPDATRLLDLEDIPIRGATDLTRLALKLKDFSGLKPVQLPATFKGKLRDYQQHGLNWLQFLREHQLGGILADDMGLGKTVQTLANLAVEKRAGRLTQPSLLVAPTSLMGNWWREAARFTPNLKLLVLHGPDRAADFRRLSEFDLVLTTYPLLPRDRQVLLKQPWHYLILDEAQQIKNPRAQAAQVVRALDARHRLCLTGTPMENHLGELWAQFDFLMPNFLGSRESFNRNYRVPIEKDNNHERLARLIQRISPFMLRRTKDLVAAELPPKTELLRATPISGKQAQLYESIRLTMEKKVREAIAAKGLGRSHIIVLEALLKLRQVCCDPRLLPAGTPGVDGAPSAKMALLFDLLPELLEEGRRVLLFSQFTTMLGLIENELSKRGIAYAKLTGQTRKRDEAIERFRSGEVGLFLISLKAGGVGLNLTEADTVIHYDPWWNPAVEHQATDRAHRIGQDKPVFIYRLVTEGTVEEKILALQQRKQKLADDIYGKGRQKDEPPIDEATIQALLAGD
ncbi:MAG: DEAD/DEAH box helicase [Wenzhouxiangellaceae bacterium]|nr:DEAD/DEAH box helicase [Wenzhouxiangellaceae bacterium]